MSRLLGFGIGIVTYPAEENCLHIDYFSSPLPRILMEQREQVIESEATCRRWDEAVYLMEWTLDRFPVQHSAVLTPFDVLSMLCAVGVYAQTGKGEVWMEKAREEMGR